MSETPEQNLVRLSGVLVEKSALRHTPTGIPVQGFLLAHSSGQIENALPREVVVELEALALGQVALVLKAADMGVKLVAEGFLAQKSLRNKRPVLHVNRIEFIEGP